MAVDNAETASTHWDAVWQQRRPEQVTWYQSDPSLSLRLITQVTGPDAAVVDVGGGASRLVDGLLEAGYSDLTVLDIADPAMAAARERIGEPSKGVAWLIGDVTSWAPARQFDLWHDRAVLHFLVEESDRALYLERLWSGVAPDGHVVLSTFSPQGPQQCSGLPVRRYGPDTMTDALGPEFEPLEFVEEVHQSPTGGTQEFLYGLFRRVATQA
jgi:SAM-dependent methyltransferase